MIAGNKNGSICIAHTVVTLPVEIITYQCQICIVIILCDVWFYLHRDWPRQLRRPWSPSIWQAGGDRFPSWRQTVLWVSACLWAGREEEHHLSKEQPVVGKETQLCLYVLECFVLPALDIHRAHACACVRHYPHGCINMYVCVDGRRESCIINGQIIPAVCRAEAVDCETMGGLIS